MTPDASVDRVHAPVMLAEVLRVFEPVGGGFYVDATVGAGGHSEAILERWPESRVLGIDHDPQALETARARLARFGERVQLLRGNFKHLGCLLRQAGAQGADGILMDLGVSSMHFDSPDRGFTYSAPEAPLDMRMDPAQETTAAGLLNQLDERELGRIIREYGEERWASRIAAFVVRYRGRGPVATSGDLVEIIKAAIPASARRKGGHPARRTFQALRIAVNDELGALAQGLGAAVAQLRPAARLAVISFHSLEDRLVKQSFREHAGSGGHELITKKPIVPTEDEISANPRARSAKLRALAKVVAPESAAGGSVLGSTGGEYSC